MSRWDRHAPEEILRELELLSRGDMGADGHRLFSHVYDPGDEGLRRLSREAYLRYMDKTMLNFTIYPSVLKMEREVVSIVKGLFNAGEGAVGNYTYGGTESIFLALKTARDYMAREKGVSKPNIILPVTGHPAFIKASEYLGIEVRLAGLDDEYRADLEDVNEKIDRDTVAVIGSAPSYPYGTMDDIEGLSELALDHDTWLHVDACIGGFILPFLRDLGAEIPPYDFELEGVKSLSVDLHKYGYTPKGGSIILYRDRELRLPQIYVNASWPGYPLVNTTILSTRSAGPLAAAYATLKYLGYEGYLKLARKVLEAREVIIRGLRRMGFEILGRPVSSIVAFTSSEVDLYILAQEMMRRGWYIQLQPGSAHLGFPTSIHLTITPVHWESADEFLEELERTISEIRGMGEDKHMDEVPELDSIDQLMRYLGLDRLSFDKMDLVNRLIHLLPPQEVEKIFREVVNRLYP